MGRNVSQRRRDAEALSSSEECPREDIESDRKIGAVPTHGGNSGSACSARGTSQLGGREIGMTQSKEEVTKSDDDMMSGDSVLESAFGFDKHNAKSLAVCIPEKDMLSSKISYLEVELSNQTIHAISKARLSARGRRSVNNFVFKSLPHVFKRHVIRKWIASPVANMVFGSVIAINAVYLGFETDLRTDEGLVVDSNTWLPWFICDSLFLCIFTVELSLRVWSEGMATLRDLWNLFDLVMVTLGILDCWVFQFVLKGVDNKSMSVLMLLRLGRLVRLARVLRILRLFRFLRALTLLAQGILGAVRTLGWAFFLISMVLYMSAVLVTTLYGDSEIEDIQIWFGSLGSSLLTLFQLMTLEDWPRVARRVMTVPGWGESWIFFIPFIGLTNFVLLNVITGVVVERVLSVANGQSMSDTFKADSDRLRSMRELREIFAIMDPSQSGYITKQQFDEGLKAREVKKRFQALGFMMFEIDRLYLYLEVDTNQPVKTLDLVEGCLRMSGGAQAKHLLRLQCDILRSGRQSQQSIHRLIKQLSWVARRLSRQKAIAKSGDGRTPAPVTRAHAPLHPETTFAVATVPIGIGDGLQTQMQESPTSADAFHSHRGVAGSAATYTSSFHGVVDGEGQAITTSLLAAAPSPASWSNLSLCQSQTRQNEQVARGEDATLLCVSSPQSPSSNTSQTLISGSLHPLMRRIEHLAREQLATRTLIQAYASEVKHLQAAAKDLQESFGNQPSQRSGASSRCPPSQDCLR
eukprot:TRINITY_DN3009_c0_g2_i1.p1 TRINITY_DN3009_c0_g2~~TRINITY_DN3009_c0_g2_i1.p1  ORF type:complete len:750 (-),score=56.35 TRINITY_DN3009_c0_g2_i1:237-2486(-)